MKETEKTEYADRTESRICWGGRPICCQKALILFVTVCNQPRKILPTEKMRGLKPDSSHYISSTQTQEGLVE